MSTTKFTEGEWIIGDYCETYGVTKIGTNEKYICDIEFDSEEDDHNAHLIAASPLLYKALEGALKMLEGIYESPNVEGAALFVGGNDIIDIQEALASARGES